MTPNEYMDVLTTAAKAGVSPAAAVETANAMLMASKQPSPAKIAPAFIQRLWLDGLSLHKIALATGITPQEVEDIMRKRTARLAGKRRRR